MLKNLHLNSLSYLLTLFNAIFIQNKHPSFGKSGIILPSLKPNTDLSLPVFDRPITLSSVLGKLFKKILNKRLVWYLESYNLLSPFQYGFRKERNTIQAQPFTPISAYIPSSLIFKKSYPELETLHL